MSAYEELVYKVNQTELDCAVIYWGKDDADGGEKTADELASLRAESEARRVALEEAKRDLAAALLLMYSSEEEYQAADKIAERHWKTWEEVKKAAVK